MKTHHGKEEKINLKELSPREFETEIVCSMALLGQPAYRMKQIRDWLFKQGVDDFFGMTNLSASLIRLLKAKYEVSTLEKNQEKAGRDGSKKVLWRLRDGQGVESVTLPTEKGVTFCISTQVGCPMGCVFCATGQMGFIRNLTPGEIVDQILFLRREMPSGGTPNIVFMGMGEPFLNFSNLMAALKILTRKELAGIGEKRMTISTLGIPDRIRAFADMGTKVRLAVSLNAAAEKQRRELMPATAGHSLKALFSALVYYYQKTGIRISLEYIVIPGVNASTGHVSLLAEQIRDLPVKVNLITCNPLPNRKDPAGSEEETVLFGERLRKALPLCVTVRKSLGAEIHAACGQLAGRGKP